jgi:hypothetical protein
LEGMVSMSIRIHIGCISASLSIHLEHGLGAKEIPIPNNLLWYYFMSDVQQKHTHTHTHTHFVVELRSWTRHLISKVFFNVYSSSSLRDFGPCVTSLFLI